MEQRVDDSRAGTVAGEPSTRDRPSTAELEEFIKHETIAAPGSRMWKNAGDNLERGDPALLKVGRGTWRGVLFEDEIHVDLGGPRVPSSLVIHVTSDVSTIRPGRITLVGPDLQDIKGPGPVPFGAVMLVAGRDLDVEMEWKIRNAFILGDQIEGFAQRAVPRQSWYRVSKEIVNRGIGFKMLGVAFSRFLSGLFPGSIESTELFFATVDVPLVKKIGDFESRSKAFYRLSPARKKYRDDCDLDMECGGCEYKPVCSGIEDIAKMRREGKNHGGDDA